MVTFLFIPSRCQMIHMKLNGSTIKLAEMVCLSYLIKHVEKKKCCLYIYIYIYIYAHTFLVHIYSLYRYDYI